MVSDEFFCWLIPVALFVAYANFVDAFNKRRNNSIAKWDCDTLDDRSLPRASSAPEGELLRPTVPPDSELLRAARGSEVEWRTEQ
jgi:hypothetical protein